MPKGITLELACPIVFIITSFLDSQIKICKSLLVLFITQALYTFLLVTINTSSNCSKSTIFLGNSFELSVDGSLNLLNILKNHLFIA
nr:MAG TPA: hypothetical protein [Caudoviricetes sp.]